MTYANIAEAKELYKESGCDLPHVRGDWFVAAAARPPLYHDILQLPQTEQELETLLHVDVQENIRSGQVARAGFNGSAVSRNNRMIERHESSYGYYWKSYDFAKNIDRQNLFSHPLGPGAAASNFRHDGGELIFSLPNGFQGYLLVDATGRRIDKGPTEIVSDPKQPDRAVENGLSCMSCHVRGMLPKDDQVRAHVEKNMAAFSKQELEVILSQYLEKDKFQLLIQEDADKFRKALEQAGMPPAVSEPIKALSTVFEMELDLPLAAAEAQLKPEDLQKLLAKTPALARVLGSLQTAGGTVQRETFTDSYPALAKAAKTGTPRIRHASIAGITKSQDETPEDVRKPAMVPKSKTKSGTTAKNSPTTKQRAFKSTVLELTEKSPPNWIFKEAKVGALLHQGRDYSFTALPKEIVGGTMIWREGLAGWLDPATVRALKDCSVYALLRTREHGKEQLGEVMLTKFIREGWEEVNGAVKTSVDGSFDTRWIALRRDVPAGDVILQLDTIDFGMGAAIFVFQEGAANSEVVADDKRTATPGSKPGPKGLFRSTVVEFTDKASPNWIFKVAKTSTQIWSDKPYMLTFLPKEVVGGSLLLRDSGQTDWFPGGSVTALKDCHAYVLIRWKYLGKEEVGEVTFTKFEREGWEEVDGKTSVNFPGGEDWQWKVLKKPVSAGDVILPLETINWGKIPAIFVFKADDSP